MIERIHRIREILFERYPGTDLVPISADDAEVLRKEYLGIPEDLILFLREVGCGRIGKGRYMIHGPTDPDAIFDDKIANQLAGIVLVGDDFSGGVEAFDRKNGWVFGSIGSQCEFVPSKQFGGFIDFVEEYYARTET